MSAADVSWADKWEDAFFSKVLLEKTASDPRSSRALLRADSALRSSQAILVRIIGASADRFDREVHHHGALLFPAWEGFRYGILSLLLAGHGNYAAADATSRTALETVLTGACVDRLVHEEVRRRTDRFKERFRWIAEALRQAASEEGPPLPGIAAESALAVPLVGELWGRKIRFDELLEQLDAFGLLQPLDEKALRDYVAYSELSGAAHAAPTRTELYLRMIEGVGGPFDLAPEFLPAAAEGALDRLHRCMDAGLLVSLNELTDCVLTRPESAAALRDAVTAWTDPAVLPQSRAGVRRILDGQGTAGPGKR